VGLFGRAQVFLTNIHDRMPVILNSEPYDLCSTGNEACEHGGILRSARMWVMFKVASWNLNSVRSRLTHVTAWLQAREPDVLLLQELKGTEFPSEVFKSLGYESVAVTQKAYNGVAILSRHPMETVAKALVGDDSDSHARFLEVIIKGIRIVNIYLPNGNPVGSDKFAYKLAWMDRLTQQMIKMERRRCADSYRRRLQCDS